jgi:hypothetical protein
LPAPSTTESSPPYNRRLIIGRKNTSLPRPGCYSAFGGCIAFPPPNHSSRSGKIGRRTPHQFDCRGSRVRRCRSSSCALRVGFPRGFSSERRRVAPPGKTSGARLARAG